jgi:hypothetical protein
MNRSQRLLAAGTFLVALSACKASPAELEALAVAALQEELPVLQEQYRSVHGVYAAHIRDLTGGADALPSGVRVIVRGGTAAGWAASSSHPAAPGAVCAAYLGEPGVRVQMTGRVAPTEPGVVTCIAFEPWVKSGIIERSGPFAMRPVSSLP